jgi:hypothetical protein
MTEVLKQAIIPCDYFKIRLKIRLKTATAGELSIAIIRRIL